MDVTNSNASDRVNKKKFKSPAFNTNVNRFSIEIYFIWFGVLIFATETIVGMYFQMVIGQIPLVNPHCTQHTPVVVIDASVIHTVHCVWLNRIWYECFIFLLSILFQTDLWLTIYYFQKAETQYALITLSILTLPAVLCQIYSLCLLRTDKDISGAALAMHVLLLGIPYRYVAVFIFQSGSFNRMKSVVRCHFQLSLMCVAIVNIHRL